MGSAATRRPRLSSSKRRAAAEAAPTAPAEAAPEVEAPAEDPYEQLEKLGKLHQDGILTDEEFATAKAKLLA